MNRHFAKMRSPDELYWSLVGRLAQDPRDAPMDRGDYALIIALRVRELIDLGTILTGNSCAHCGAGVWRCTNVEIKNSLLSGLLVTSGHPVGDHSRPSAPLDLIFCLNCLCILDEDSAETVANLGDDGMEPFPCEIGDEELATANGGAEGIEPPSNMFRDDTLLCST